jgi:hypothetical protein
MHRLQLAASLLVALILLALVVVLWTPAFLLPFHTRSNSLGPGALPQLSMLAISFLTLIYVVRDLINYFQVGRITGASQFLEGSTPKNIALQSALALVLLGLYLVGWTEFGFVFASILFLASLSFVLLPREKWTARASLLILCVSFGFGVTVWAVFSFALKVPLR